MRFNWGEFVPPDSEHKIWDVIIVGAGMGGGTLGCALARKGLKVLFLERGAGQTRFESLSDGRVKRLLRLERPENRLEAMGHWARPITRMKKGRAIDFVAPLGSGPGGSSAIYGGGLERMRRIDFSDRGKHDQTSPPMPHDWPIDYDEFRFHYRAAEEMFGVVGTRDPDDPDDDTNLGQPPALSPRDQDFFDSFQANGLKPYRVHVGFAYRPGCRECIGVPCTTDCKADGSSRGVCPALRDFDAKILLNCEVERLEATHRRVTAIIAKTPSGKLGLRARVVVLAAGALSTPLLLRRSTSPEWPNGLGNGNDLVGRCLMFHASDLIALWPRRKVSSDGPQKTLSSRAFYSKGGQKLGSLQSLGLPVSHHAIFESLTGRLDRFTSVKIPFAHLAIRFISVIASVYFKRTCVFATIIEDFPYFNNRVVPDPSRPSGFYIEYVKSREFNERIAAMRSSLQSSLAVHKPWILTGEDNINIGHPCGTCRFGTDPTTSVLDPNNKLWGMENLYVADASFFPSSGGTNPALTVAANALRISDLITAEASRN